MRPRRVGAVLVKELRQLWRDRRTLALLVFQPVLLLIIFGYAASFDLSRVDTAVVGPGAERAAERLPEALRVTELAPEADRAGAVERLRAGDVAVAVVTGGTSGPTVLLDGAQLFAAQSARAALTQAPAGATVGPRPTVEVLFNPELETPPVLIPALAGIVLVVGGTIGTSLAVVRERAEGTLEQLAVLPLSPGDVLAGKVAPYLLVMIVDLVLVVLVGWGIFGVPFVGSVGLLAGSGALFLLVVAGGGLLVSAVSQNQAQALQLSMMVAMPQILLSGAIFPVEAMARPLQWIAVALPLTWFVEILRGIMLRGEAAADLVTPLAVLAVMAVVVFGLALATVRRDLVPVGPGKEPSPEAAGAAEGGA